MSGDFSSSRAFHRVSFIVMKICFENSIIYRWDMQYCSFQSDLDLTSHVELSPMAAIREGSLSNL